MNDTIRTLVVNFFINFLRRNNLLQEFDEEVSNQRKINRLYTFLNRGDIGQISDIFNLCLTWDRTNRGYDYWSGIGIAFSGSLIDYYETLIQPDEEDGDAF